MNYPAAAARGNTLPTDRSDREKLAEMLEPISMRFYIDGIGVSRQEHYARQGLA